MPVSGAVVLARLAADSALMTPSVTEPLVVLFVVLVVGSAPLIEVGETVAEGL